MRINFDNDINAVSAINNQSQIHQSATSVQSSAKHTEANAFAISLGDSNAMGLPAQQDKTDAGKWQENLGMTDTQMKRNYMSVMSLSMSNEDYAQLVATGQAPEDMDAGDSVTIIDEIKAAVIEGGSQVLGYTDTIDKKTLEEITGSAAAAEELIKAMSENDVALSENNIKAAADAINLAEQIVPVSESAVLYLMENDKAATIRNIYEATHSGIDSESKNNAYISQNGYIGRFATTDLDSDLNKLMPQIEEVIKKSGLEVGDYTKNEAIWLIDKGIGLTRETLLELDKLNSIHKENIVNAVAIAMGAGIEPEKANLTYTESIYTMAQAYYDKYFGDNIESETETESLTEAGLRDRRLLEEVRLTMSVEANRLLLRSNFQIDIAPMEELIEALRVAEKTINEDRFPAEDYSVTEARAEIYKQTKDELAQIPGLPAAIIGEKNTVGEWRFANIRTYSLHDVYEIGTSRKEAYAKAEESYEAIMTAPRKDLGDSIHKAFRNVDDILQDLGLDLNEENRRSVRILGYNSMEISAESISLIREADENIRKTINRLTPSRVLEMIREDANPLKMSLDELNEYLDAKDDNPEKKAENYARFLMQLERQDEITELERDSYIGIYRMLSKLDKTDDAAIGSLLQAGLEINFSNILAAMRTVAKGHMDYIVSDSFGGVSAKIFSPAIDEQINAAFSDDKELMQEEYTEIVSRLEDESITLDSEINLLLNAGMIISPDNLEVARLYRKGKTDWFETAEKINDEDDPQSVIDEAIGSFDDSDSAIEAYENMMDRIKDKVSQNMLNANTYLDIRAIQSCLKQMTFLKQNAQNETYEFPTEIDGEMTSIRLQIRRQKGAGELSITMETDSYGKIAAQFNLSGTKSGFIAFERRDGEVLAQNIASDMAEELPFVPNIIFAPDLSPDKFIQNNITKEKASKEIKEDASQADINNTELYRIAKLFISKVRK